MYFVSKKLKKKYNITDERAALYEAADTWVGSLKGRIIVFNLLLPLRKKKKRKQKRYYCDLRQFLNRWVKP